MKIGECLFYTLVICTIAPNAEGLFLLFCFRPLSNEVVLMSDNLKELKLGYLTKNILNLESGNVLLENV